MKTLTNIDYWVSHHRTYYLDFVRIVLGGFLIWKAVDFGEHPKDIQTITDNGPFDFLSLVMVQYIIMTHFAGGVLIMLGLLTRISVLFQIPVLLGAVIFTPLSDSGPVYLNELSGILVLCLLIVFLIYGSGRISVDAYMNRHPNY
ncbi:MAG: DoxX family protein [Bacteroidia bacterium]